MRSPLLAIVSTLCFIALMPGVARAADARRPNVLVILTDDQGWGDLGVNGNEKIHTPNIDRFARAGVQFSRFYVSPVCAPTRASVMTGRYNFRTRAIDTYQGRAIMHPEEITVAEVLSNAGYRTGIFGKWHLGDHYPCRPIDQGFREALVHAGGGIAQPSDPPEGNSYFDPWLEHDGKAVKAKGYCSDVFTSAAMNYIDACVDAKQPFFVYLAFNAPHTPLQVADDLAKPYREAMLDEPTAKLYAMVSNIDDNVGRLLKLLDDRNLTDDTLVIFFSDNGPQSPRFNGKLRSTKGSVYDGGIHVPCFMRWPDKFPGKRTLDTVAAHIDLMPTILQACDVAPPKDVKLDGKSLMPLLLDQAKDWPDRTLYFQWHRGDAPDAGRCCAAVGQRYKLVQPLGMQEGPPPKELKWELYDLADDPGETRDLAMVKPEILVKMRDGYQKWFADVSATRGYEPVPISIGSDHENPVLLTRQDLRESDRQEKLPGFWEIHVERAGKYQLSILFDPAKVDRKAVIKIGTVETKFDVPAGEKEQAAPAMQLEAGQHRLQVSLEEGSSTTGVSYVRVERKP